MTRRVWVQVVPHGRLHAAQVRDVAGAPMYRLPCAKGSGAVVPVKVYDSRPAGLAVCAKPRCSRIFTEEEIAGDR